MVVFVAEPAVMQMVWIMFLRELHNTTNLVDDMVFLLIYATQ